MKQAHIRPCSCGACMLLRLDDINDFIRYQHGENPEHVLEISAHELCMATSHRNGYRSVGECQERWLSDRVKAWTDSIHAFEQDGRWVGQPE